MLTINTNGQNQSKLLKSQVRIEKRQIVTIVDSHTIMENVRQLKKNVFNAEG